MPPRSPDQREATLDRTYAEAMRRAAPGRHLARGALSPEVATGGAAGRERTRESGRDLTDEAPPGIHGYCNFECSVSYQ